MELLIDIAEIYFAISYVYAHMSNSHLLWEDLRCLYSVTYHLSRSHSNMAAVVMYTKNDHMLILLYVKCFIHD